MSSAEKEQKRISRREFVKGAAVGAAGVAAAGALASCAPAATPCPTPEVIKETVEVPVEVIRECPPCPTPWLPEKWDKEADVVVVGYGGAGVAAALTAHDGGAKVILLEKMPEGKEGGNTKVSSNNIFIPDTTLSDAKQYMRSLLTLGSDFTRDKTDEMIEAWAVSTMANLEWFESLGLEVAYAEREPEHDVPGGDCVSKYNVVTNNTAGVGAHGCSFRPLAQQLRNRGIEVLYETPGHKLIQNPLTKEMLGVVAIEGTEIDNVKRGIYAKKGGREIYIKAKKAVILTTGSYEFNEVMKRNYMNAPCYGAGCPGNTGDGVRMAMDVGADLWHLSGMGPKDLGLFIDDFGPEIALCAARISMRLPTCMFVDQHGKRFMDENQHAKHGRGWDEIEYFHGEPAGYPRIPWWYVFDEVNMARPLLTGTTPGEDEWGETRKNSWFGWYSGYTWSDDNLAELERGWFLKGDTPEMLAAQMGVDPATLADTFTKFNAYATAGEDPMFERPADSMAPLVKQLLSMLLLIRT